MIHQDTYDKIRSDLINDFTDAELIAVFEDQVIDENTLELLLKYERYEVLNKIL